MKIITKENFNSVIDESTKPVLVDFWASWCGPCQRFSSTLEEFSDSNNNVLVGKVNVDEQMELAEQFEVMSIPTLALFKDGKLVSRASGVMSKSQLEEFVR